GDRRGRRPLGLGVRRLHGFGRGLRINIVADGAALLADTVGEARPRRHAGASERFRLDMVDDFLGARFPDTDGVPAKLVGRVAGLVQQVVDIIGKLRHDRPLPIPCYLGLSSATSFRSLGLLRLGWPLRLLALLLVGTDPLLNWQHDASCLGLLADVGDVGVADAGLFGDRPVGLLRVRRHQLGQGFTLLLVGQVPPTNVHGDDEGGRIIAFEIPISWLDTRCAAGTIAIPAIKDHAVVENDLLPEAIRLDVVDELIKLGTLQGAKLVGKRVKLVLLSHAAPPDSCLASQAASASALMRGCPALPTRWTRGAAPRASML